MRKIVYLLEQPFDERNYNRMGIQTWVDRGWCVEVWDMTPLLCPIVWQRFFKLGKKIKHFEGYYVISSEKKLEERYFDVSEIDYFVDYTDNSTCSQRVKKHLQKAGSKMIISANVGSIPSIAAFDNNGTGNKLWCKLKRAISIGPVMTTKLLARKLSSTLMQCKIVRKDIIVPSLIVVSGEKSIRSNPPIGGQEIIKAHNFDYDIYLNLVKSPVTFGASYGLFVDQDLCFHSDYLYSNLKPFVTPAKYFSSLSRGLKRISKALETEIQIAKHPREGWTHVAADYFEGLTICSGSTMELISQAKFVVGHYSTVLQVAVLFKKPLIFVTTEELRNTTGGSHTEIRANILGKQAINLDGDLNQVDWEKELFIDLKKYDAYRREYIKADGTPELPSWDIVINHIEQNDSNSLLG
jgi:hypothetical protein